MAKIKAQERKELEERRKMDNEEIEDELTELEAKLNEEEEEEDSSDSEEEEWRLSCKKKGKENEKQEDRIDDDGEQGENTDEEKSYDIESEESNDEGSGNIESEGSNDEGSSDDEVYFVPGVSKRNRIIESDDEEEGDSVQVHRNKEHDYNSQENVIRMTDDNMFESCDSKKESCGMKEKLCDIKEESCDPREESCDPREESCDPREESCDIEKESHDLGKDGTCDAIPHSGTLEEASMEPLVFTGTLDQEDSSDYPIIGTQPLGILIKEDSQLTELVNDEDECDLEMTYQFGPSLPPPHQVPRVTREESDEIFMTTPSVTRQSSTVSDKVRMTTHGILIHTHCTSILIHTHCTSILIHTHCTSILIHTLY